MTFVVKDKLLAERVLKMEFSSPGANEPSIVYRGMRQDRLFCSMYCCNYVSINPFTSDFMMTFSNINPFTGRSAIWRSGTLKIV